MRSRDVVTGYRLRTARLRGNWWRLLIRLYGGQAGKGLQIEAGFQSRWGPHSGWRLGDNVYLGRGVIFDCPPGGLLEVGDQVQIMHYTTVAASERVTIGARAGIGEHASVRDSDHEIDHALEAPVAPIRTAPIAIMEGAWIGRGAAVLRGSQIGRRSVVAANGVVRGQFGDGKVLAGVPARVVKELFQ